MNVNNNSNKLCIVLPTRNSEDRYFKLVMKSYDKYLDPESISKIIIIAADSTNIKEYLSSKFKYEILTDDQIITKKCEGWIKQQLIKILTYKYVDTQYYLVTDNDIFLKEKLTYNDLFINKKIRARFERQDQLNIPSYSSSKWWLSSEKLLNYSIPTGKELLSVSPQVFVTDYVKFLDEELKMKYEIKEEDWEDHFIKLVSTEFSLYWLFLCKYGLEKEYMDPEFNGYNNSKFLCDCINPKLNVHDSWKDLEKIIKDGISSNSQYFFTIQSWLKIPEEIIIKIFRECNYLS